MKLNIKKDKLSDILNLQFGVFNPLKKYVSKIDFVSIVNNHRLKNGKFFPFPIYFNVDLFEYEKIKAKKGISLFFKSKKVCELKIYSIYKLNKIEIGKKLFKTNDLNHPGFEYFINSGDYFIEGVIKNFNFEIMKTLNFTPPSTIKSEILKYNLKSIAGFHTRNAPHKGHQWIHSYGLKNCEALLIQPMIGQFRTNEYYDKVIIETNYKLVKDIYKKKNILFGLFSSYPKYGGPSEALLHALVRKNYGCTHFLVGRDHAGVKDYYKKYESQNLCKKNEKLLNIKILKFKEPFLCKNCKKIINNKNDCCGKNIKKEISGTFIRNLLIKKKKIPYYLMHKKISKLLNSKSLINKKKLSNEM